MDLQLGLEAVGPEAVGESGVEVLRRMVECVGGELFDRKAGDRICGHLSYALGW